MKPDKLLDRMLKFANSPECPPERKRDVENGAWKTWADSITDHNPYSYNKVKHEKIHYVDSAPVINREVIYKRKKMTSSEWIQRRKDAQYNKQLNSQIKLKSNEKAN